ncbi:MAG TPA: HDIG domain-containing protein [Chthonomonas sp.]|jgi:putative nucleotidyltransferase with HDIG domain|uniref:HDIG domain-containing metalloprotein n=1 Tax=Chthonomonas sp. TaxID=2282153 RepID=UPI002B4AF551|nr:HDIG domain-containing metalloprotein [Chthonomonas sp.]HLH80036.1 HDIG domain-containing protein [Chthonomonas sp.]
MHDRQAAWQLVTEWTQSESLRKHMLAVEAAMRFYARKFGEDEELWGNTGLLHDFDYERNPDPPKHPTVGMKVLSKQGWPPEMIEAIGGHAEYLHIPRNTLLAKTLYAVDELCGFILAVAYTRPSRTLAEVEVNSVLKKMRQSGFARNVSREGIARGAEELGIPLEEHIANCIEALQAIAPTLGL